MYSAGEHYIIILIGVMTSLMDGETIRDPDFRLQSTSSKSQSQQARLMLVDKLLNCACHEGFCNGLDPP